ncbi:MAG: endolytic transglycosylase MltG [Gemmatimonadota bacterium]|nr:endolytic transglycosylase MltG [Gemmatimonadota bacterium]
MRSALAADARHRLVRVLLVVACCAFSACGGSNAARGGPYARVTIPSGAGFRAATDSLAHAGIVTWPRLFRLYAKIRGRDRGIRAGSYSLHRDLHWGELLSALERGEGADHPVTIPEGFALSDITPMLERAVGVSADSIKEAVHDTALLHRLDIPSGSLEGYLFPDTYQFAVGTSAHGVVAEMVKRFETMWKPEWDDRVRQLGMSRHDIVTLASIIEKEARLAEERPVISAVYHNRLRAQMPLQADPTVQYALGEHHDRLLYKDLEVSSPYNTYRHPGLPPGPIASPGRASLEAALFPANVPYKYFVANADGHHEFRETFQAHTAAVRDARRERDKHKRKP